MPSTSEILQGLTTTANMWTFVAALWHVYFAALLVAIALRWHPSTPVVASLLVPPLVSVSVLSWFVGNPFNGTIFALLSVALIWGGVRCQRKPMKLASSGWIVIAAILVSFAWIYPHFLQERPSYSYLYLAPLGLIPCPTLSMTVGVAILVGGASSRAWTLVVGIAGIFYGIFGALRLGVTIDWVLTAGGLCLLVQGLRSIQRMQKDAA